MNVDANLDLKENFAKKKSVLMIALRMEYVKIKNASVNLNFSEKTVLYKNVKITAPKTENVIVLLENVLVIKVSSVLTVLKNPALMIALVKAHVILLWVSVNVKMVPMVKTVLKNLVLKTAQVMVYVKRMVLVNVGMTF
jgi:hypothetical protein